MPGTSAANPSDRCLICGKRPTAASLCIRGQTICPDCEARLVSAEAGTPHYETYVKRLRQLWPRTSDE